MDPKDILSRIRMLEAGIVPYGVEAELKDIERGLSSLPKKDQRTAKRKFRKLWRKAAKMVDKKQRIPDDEWSTFAQASASGSEPTSFNRTIRKRLVRRHFSKKED